MQNGSQPNLTNSEQRLLAFREGMRVGYSIGYEEGFDTGLAYVEDHPLQIIEEGLPKGDITNEGGTLARTESKVLGQDSTA